MPDTLSALAARQWQDYRSRTPGSCFAEPGFQLDLPEAYRLQDAVRALRVADGESIVGYKVGCTGAGVVAQFGIQGPIRGYLFGSEVHRNDAALDGDAFVNLAIEGEMALRIGEDGNIAAAFPIIELHHYLFRSPRKTLSELVANNGFNAGIVLPDPKWLEDRSLLDASATLSVSIDDVVVARGALWPFEQGPRASLDWLKGNLAAAGHALEPGHIVLAGTPLGLYPVGRGQRVSVFVGESPAVRCSVLS
ncbi:MAG: hypothetical protein KIT73_20075 [Burkholderiales bacterium]|nr:hypothetical protein [Burkholderiales bacterium]